MGAAGVLLCLVLISTLGEIIGDPQHTSSMAFNSDGSGQVSVSCNGKTTTGEGIVACTSSAYRIGFGGQSSFFPILVPGLILLASFMSS